MENLLHPLLPKKFENDATAYKPVKELADVLDQAEKLHIRNVAVAGPFGSGKSSVLTTLMADFKSHTYLSISLATLQVNDDEENKQTEKREGEHNHLNNERDKNINKQIEYSILQQIIYKENADTLPNSRFRRITHYSKSKLCLYSILGVITTLALIYIFSWPSAITDTLYSLCNINPNNMVIKFIGICWIIYCLYVTIGHIIKSYGNSKLKKLNLIDGGIEVSEDASAFNKHLDEILYFFQVTKYDVVIIEDLDRFNPSANIFLKLRELNRLLNESKIVGRHITFVYAIRDDVFKETDRTKFFDYIITIIPVINFSNSKDKLKEELRKRGFKEDEIPKDDDISEMAFFIQDMRMLINIANEYKQYRDRLCDEKSTLDPTKLLAMIVYKNYFPADFNELQYGSRRSKVYTCISKKKEFITEALNNIEQQKEKLITEEKAYKENCVLHINELRLLFIYQLQRKISNESAIQININNKFHTLEEIAKNNELFESLREMSTISYKNSNNPSKKIDIKSIMIDLDSKMNLTDRLKALEKDNDYYKSEHERLQKRIIEIKSLKLSELFNKYISGDNPLYKQLELSPMQDIFIRRGYIDEEYYDYISYFYEGTLSNTDRKLLMSIKQQIVEPYDYHINKIENFAKELQNYTFYNDAILNNNLLDYLAEHEQSEKFELIMQRLERKNAPLQFLAQYYEYGNQQDIVFNHFINSNRDITWTQIREWKNDEEKDTLTEAYLKFCKALNKDQQKWLNDNYTFLAQHTESIGLDTCFALVTTSKFVELSNASETLLNNVIDCSKYEITLHNLWIIVQALCKDESITEKNLNLTRLRACKKDSVTNYINANINTAISCIKNEDKDESAETILYILNHDNISNELKENYLKQQTNQISDIKLIKHEDIYDIAIRNCLITPTWENVTIYFTYTKDDLTHELASYINHFADILSQSKYT
ncbi:MAG: hypothetical protein LUC91_00705, partial [Prevotella sp.]|nr:hypothetical protein [Prevotella sp.]